MSGGGLMQLIAYGAQDVYLTAPQQITYFRLTYQSRTNFAPETIPNYDSIVTPSSITEPTIVYKLLIANTECIITYIVIETNAAYWECDTCNKVVTWDAASLWISGHKNCPHCRCDSTLDKKHINAQTPDVKKREKNRSKKLTFTGNNTVNSIVNNNKQNNKSRNTANRNQSHQYQKNIKTQIRNRGR
jgi:hypothetical protein